MKQNKVLLKGIGASPGKYKGRVKVVFSPEEASKMIQKGDILVTPMTDPNFVPFMKIAGAIITNTGGVLSHAAIVSREFGIPYIARIRRNPHLLPHSNHLSFYTCVMLIYNAHYVRIRVWKAS